MSENGKLIVLLTDIQTDVREVRSDCKEIRKDLNGKADRSEVLLVKEQVLTNRDNIKEVRQNQKGWVRVTTLFGALLAGAATWLGFTK